MMAPRSLRLKQASSCAAKLKVLADPTRLAAVESLMAGPKHVGALARLLKVEQSLLSHHLQSLRAAGLVRADRDGKGVLYHLGENVTGPGAGAAIDLGCCVLSFGPTRQ